MTAHRDSSTRDEPRDSLHQRLAENMRKLRSQGSWSTRDFADHAGLSLSSLYTIEHSRQQTVRLQTVERIARALGVSVLSLLSSPDASTEPWAGCDASDIVAKNIEMLRKSKNWTQQVLADEAGMPRDIVSRIESGTRNPTLSVLERLMKALGVTPEELLARQD